MPVSHFHGEYLTRALSLSTFFDHVSRDEIAERTGFLLIKTAVIRRVEKMKSSVGDKEYQPL
jgi:hypothetical protein